MYAIDYRVAKERLDINKENIKPIAVMRREGKNLLLLSEECIDILDASIKEHLLKIEDKCFTYSVS